MTDDYNEILESINTKDKLYKFFVQADKTNDDRLNVLIKYCVYIYNITQIKNIKYINLTQ